MIPEKFLTMLFLGTTALYLFSCNPVGEKIDDPLWNSRHNEKPFQSDYFHSADYRFPHNACDEVQCHGTSLAGGNSGAPSCTACHDSQWVIFGVSHTKKISKYYHRYNVNDYSSERVSNANWFASCKDASCHGATLDGVQGGPSADFPYRYSCKVCHSGFTGTIPPPGHSVKKGSAMHHVDYEEGDHNFSYCSGAACHGTSKNTAGTAASSLAGLAGHGQACNSSGCHD